MEYLKEIEKVKEEISKYYGMSFEDDEADYNYNKTIKNRLKEIIIRSKSNNNIVEKALLVLAESTGCSEDQEIAEEIIDYLHDNQYVNKEQLDFFYKHIGTGRWV